LPLVNFSLPEICLPDGRGTFTNSSSIPDNTDALFTYNWNFGDAANTTPSVLKVQLINTVHWHQVVDIWLN
jgi:hypothetical protein